MTTPSYTIHALNLIRPVGEVTVIGFKDMACISHSAALSWLSKLCKAGMLKVRYEPLPLGGTKAFYRCAKAEVVVIPPMPVWSDTQRLAICGRWV